MDQDSTIIKVMSLISWWTILANVAKNTDSNQAVYYELGDFKFL